jgi:signal transduction histidine kinase
LTIGTHFVDTELILQIIDNGRGASAMDMDKFFSAMEQGGNDGTSILRINATREQVKDFSGVVRVDSAPGKGTKVTIRLPMSHT